VPGLPQEDAGARAALERAFSDDAAAKSGKFRGTLTTRPDGEAAARFGAGNVQINGAFIDSPGKRREKLFLDASADIAGQRFRFGVVATGGAVFVAFGGRYYEVPKSQLRQSTSSSQLSSLGFNPREWFKDARDEGSASVGGVETTHLSAGFDVGKMVDDLVVLAQRFDYPGASPSEASEVKDSIKDAQIDAYVAKNDRILRRVTFHALVEAVGGGSGEIDADFTLSDINKPQRITAPASARPFSQLESDLRSGGLQSLVGAPGQSSAPPPPPGDSSGAAQDQASSLPAEAQAYLACVRKASSQAAVQACSSHLP
jgi:hypothetical protein